MKKFILVFLFCFSINSFGGIFDNSFNNVEISGEIKYSYEKTNKNFKNKKHTQKNTTKIVIE